MASRGRQRELVGIKRRGPSWFVTVRVNGHLYTDTFPLETPFETMQAWRVAQIHRYGATHVPNATGSFAADIEAYLVRVAAMPSIGQRAAHLEVWAQELGRDRPRSSITTAEIDAVIQRWQLDGVIPPGARGPRPSRRAALAPGTVRRRKTSLQSFFNLMNGKGGANPARSATVPPEPKPEPRDIDRLVIDRIIAAMPEWQDTKPGAIRRLNLGRLRVAVMAATGIPPGLLQQIRPTDLILSTPASVRVPRRKKGGGIAARLIPLTEKGRVALQAFHAANAYGVFAIAALNRSFKRAARRAGLDAKRVRLYDLRHSFLTDLYRATHDLATVGRLGLHAPGSTITARYAQGANDDVDAAAVAKLDAARPDPPANKLAAPVSKTRKSRRIIKLVERA